jgi:hypothetical protein
MVPAVLRRTFAEMERRTNIKRIHTHGEKAAAYMADGYARASGKPGVCMAQVVGALNLAAGLRDAYLAHSPVMALGGVSSLRLQRVLESPRNHIRIRDGTRIHWTASADEWVTMTYLLDPFLDGATGHHYLTNEGFDDVLVEVSYGESHRGLNERASPNPSVP